MKTIQIPSVGESALTPKKSCVDFGDYLNICFDAKGYFLPDGNGGKFNPPILAMDVNLWDFKGPYYPPSEKFSVTWTFTPSDGSAPSNGTIDVKQDANCRQATQPKCGP